VRTTVLRTLLKSYVEEDEVGAECSVHGGDEKCVQNFGLDM
jgi:hypothetical protein